MQTTIPGRSVAIFKINAKFVNGSLCFTPSVDEVREMLYQRLSDGIRMIYSQENISDDESFKVYMSTLDDETEKEEGKVNPLKTIEETSELVLRKEQISNVLESAFAQLNDYSKEMQPFIKIYQEHCARDFSKLEGQQDQVYRMWVDQFEKDKAIITESLDDIKTLGIISVDANELKASILLKPKESRRKMEEIIPIHSEAIINYLLKKMKDIDEGILASSHADIDKYVSHKKFLEEHRKNTDEYDEQLLKARCLHGIMLDFQMQLSNKRRKELESLDNKWKNVKEKLKLSAEKWESLESTQKAILAKKVPEMREELNKLIVDLDSEKYYKKTETPQTIVENLVAIQGKISNCRSLCEKIEENEAYLQMTKDDFPEQLVLNEKHTHLLKFWTDQQFWSEKKLEWFQTQIKVVETEVIKQKIIEMKNCAKEAEIVLSTKYERNLEIAKVFY